MLNRVKSSEWFVTDYTMNIYRGCNLGCIYCDSRSECYRIDRFEEVAAKVSAIAMLNQRGFNLARAVSFWWRIMY